MIDSPKAPNPKSAGARLRNYFLTGIILVGPLAVTLYITWWFVNTVDGWVRPIVPASLWPDSYLPFHVPGLGVIIAGVGLTLLGFLTANLVGNTLIRLSERLLDRMPVVRSIYKSMKQIFETLFSQSGTSFRKVALIEYPGRGMWSLAFISSSPEGSVKTYLPQGDAYISVFLPCTPNPTTGFYIFMPVKDVHEIPMTPDDAFKLIMSAGLIQPEAQAMLLSLAENSKSQAKQHKVDLSKVG